MPEGHVIHRLARELNAQFAGAPVNVSSPQGRFATEATSLDGAAFSGAEAWGKHLFLHFGDTTAPDARIIHIHLGLIGTFTLEPFAEPRGQVRLRIDNGSVAADLRGPQRCVIIGPSEEDTALGKLGVDPLRPVGGPSEDGALNEEKRERAFTRTRRSSKPIGALLMDQSMYAGVGSIYRTEALFRAGINPNLPGTSVTEGELEDIWQDMVVLMDYGLEHGRIDTVRDEHTPEAMGREPRKDDHGGEVYVYRRAGLPCLVCGTPVELGEMAARKIYWCPVCQAGR